MKLFLERLRYAFSKDYVSRTGVKALNVALSDARADIESLQHQLARRYLPDAEARVRGLEQGLAAANETALLQKQGKDSAYMERNRCVVLIARMALALGWCAGVGEHEDKPGQQWDDDWRTIIFVDLPAGQVSWHFHDSHREMLAGLPKYLGRWDGHDVAEKYRRVADF